jgi:hypothetical protein
MALPFIILICITSLTRLEANQAKPLASGKLLKVSDDRSLVPFGDVMIACGIVQGRTHHC